MSSPILFWMKLLILGEIFLGTLAAAQDASPAASPPAGAVVYDIDATINALPGRVLSGEFTSGPYLIFDCRSQTFICVNESGFDYCRQIRQESQAAGKQILDCAPLKNYLMEEKCGAAAQKAIDHLAAKNFCYGQYPAKYTVTPTPAPTIVGTPIEL